MRGAQLRRLPVIDDGERLVGVLSLNDIAREFANERPLLHKEIEADDVAVILATVSAHRIRPGQELTRQATPEPAATARATSPSPASRSPRERSEQTTSVDSSSRRSSRRTDS
jgi:CBS domain-containing protein